MAETTEQMLSRMAMEREECDAFSRGLTVKELRTFRRTCDHEWQVEPESGGLIDVCLKCGEGRA